MLFAHVQEAADLALIARRIAEESETPFFNVQDGFLTTHTIESLQLPEPKFMKQFVGDPKGEHRLRNLMDPAHPIMSGVVQNQDSYMKGKIAQRYFYDRIPSIMKRVMDEFFTLTGRRYGMIDTYRVEDADYVLVGMGSLAETATATASFLREKQSIKVGTLHVASFRPFPGPEIVEALKNAKAVAVIERMDNPMAQSGPLTAEIKAAFSDALSGVAGYPKIDHMPFIYSGAAGLGSRDVRPGDFLAVVNHLRQQKEQRFFVLGIKHDLALEVGDEPDVRPRHAFSMRGHSVGGYGSVTTNKVIATIVGDLLGIRVQAYPMYGSEKKGLPTTYFLTVAEEPIGAHAELRHVDFVPLNDVNAFNLGNPLSGLVPGRTVFIQHQSTDPVQVWKTIPAAAQQFIRHNRIRVLALDAVKIAQEVSNHPQLVQRMQGIVLLGVFLRVAPFIAERGLSDAEVYAAVEKSLRKFFGKRGEKVVKENLAAVERGRDEVFEIPRQVIAQAA
jgi:pyruvate-ferredoxin/flavodoxin oxidoreductase